jgi:cytoplasmic tRNA 2-thiolation protein 2
VSDLSSDLKLLEREQTTESGAKDRLVGMFKSLDDKLNSKEDLLYHFRMILLERVARREGCCVVMLGESKTRLAVRALSLTIKGRGEQLPIDVASEARVAPGISFVRPLKEIFPDEMAHFNRSLGLESALLPSVTSGLPFKASIERLTENLIVGLQNDFPATAGAVSKTAEKVTTRTTEGLIGPFPSDGFEPARGDFPKCSICLANIHPDDFMWRRLQTVETLEEIGNRESGPGKEAGVGRAIQDGPSSTDAFLHLCYSCQNIARDLAASTVPSRKADVSPPILPWDLPPHSGEAVAANRARMKLQIDEHLLEE